MRIVILKTIAITTISWVLWKFFRPLEPQVTPSNKYPVIIGILAIAGVVFLISRKNIVKVVDISICTIIGVIAYEIIGIIMFEAFYIGSLHASPATPIIGGAIGGLIGIILHNRQN